MNARLSIAFQVDRQIRESANTCRRLRPSGAFGAEPRNHHARRQDLPRAFAKLDAGTRRRRRANREVAPRAPAKLPRHRQRAPSRTAEAGKHRHANRQVSPRASAKLPRHRQCAPSSPSRAAETSKHCETQRWAPGRRDPENTVTQTATLPITGRWRNLTPGHRPPRP